MIPIIDLFAGPGGLGEGFTSVVDESKERVFKIALSIECDGHAHQTLTLRSFIRQFPFKQIPDEYYEYIRGEIKLDLLFKLYPLQAKSAKKEAWQFKLGTPDTNRIVDYRIHAALNGKENFVLIGGPPCQAYSLAGRARRQEMDGLRKEDERVYLYREYYRILAVHRPAVFIMENVKGILSSKVEKENLFTQIINDLEDPIKAYNKLQGKERFYKSKIGYKIFSLVKKASEQEDLFDIKHVTKPKDFIIRSEEYGIPQTRHRVILLGIRSDINIEHEILQPFKQKVLIEDVINGLPVIRSGLSKQKDSRQEWRNAIKEIETTNLKNETEQTVWNEIVNSVNQLITPEDDKGRIYLKTKAFISYNSEWFLDNKINGVCNHESRTHIISDLYRYMFAACFAKIHKRSPKLSDFPVSLLPKHLNIKDGIEQNKFADRFRTQLYGEPSKTVTSHISKDGHYFIHPDSTQCRSLTVREAARIQTFPDNYYFCGPRTQQFHQVGNAVPPLLAKQIGEIVKLIMQQIPIS